MSSIPSEPLVAGSPLPPLLLLMVSLSACTEPQTVDWPLDSASREVSSGFGPRLMASEDFRYDFHRGIDLPTPIGTPLLALADGVVRIGGEHDAYADGVIQVAHGDGCSGQPDNCWFATYLHISESVVADGDSVRAGQVLGYSGASESGFEHLHFEVRDGSVWQTGAVNPVSWLDLPDAGAPEVTARWSDQTVTVDVAVGSRDLDLAGIAVEMVALGGKVEATYAWSADEWNRRFTHPGTDWPAADCPHAQVHPPGTAYDPHIHLDHPVFNGVALAPAAFDADTDAWRLSASFDVDTAGIDHVRVRVHDLAGAETLTLAR